MGILVLLLVISTSAWVYFDATKISAPKAGEKLQTGKFYVDMGPVGWLICCLVLWIVAFPAYLILRPQYMQEFQSPGSASSLPSPGSAPSSQP